MKRLEQREDGIWLVVGTNVHNKARAYVLDRCFEKGRVLEHLNMWRGLNNPQPEYKVLDLSFVVRCVEKWNNSERELQLLFAKYCNNFTENKDNYIYIPDDLAELARRYDEAERQKRDEAMRLFMEAQAVAREKALQRERELQAKKERDNVIVWNGKSRGEVRELIRRGLLVETVETKTLYEMYDDGLL